MNNTICVYGTLLPQHQHSYGEPHNTTRDRGTQGHYKTRLTHTFKCHSPANSLFLSLVLGLPSTLFFWLIHLSQKNLMNLQHLIQFLCSP